MSSEYNKELGIFMPFDCKCCGKRYVPGRTGEHGEYAELILNDLCNVCFLEFDSQKMNGRWTGVMNKRTSPPKKGDPDYYFESSDEWVEHRKTSGTKDAYLCFSCGRPYTPGGLSYKFGYCQGCYEARVAKAPTIDSKTLRVLMEKDK